MNKHFCTCYLNVKKTRLIISPVATFDNAPSSELGGGVYAILKIQTGFKIIAYLAKSLS